MARRRRKTRKKLFAAGTALRQSAREPLQIPAWWLNSVIGVFLLPVAWVLTQSFFTALSRETIHHAFWATEEFWFFSLGCVLWTIFFFGLPKLLWAYVFGHELTHAIWVWAMGGKVMKFKVSSEGGHIITDTHNFWIALAPYFFPVYSVILLAVYGGVSFFYDLQPYRQVFFSALGVTWAFHISFTLWMIPKGQTDLSYHGTFFSLVVIYILNFVVLSVLLISASPHVTWISFGQQLFEDAGNFSEWAIDLLNRAIRGARTVRF